MKSIYKFLVIVAIAALTSQEAFSANTNWTWTGVTNTTWTTKTNWSTTDPDASPTNNDTIIINAGSSQYPALGGNKTVAKVVFNGGSFTYGGSTLTVNNSFILNGGGFALGNNITIGNNFTFNGGTLSLNANESIPGTFTNNNAGSISYSTFTLTTADFILNGGTFAIGNNITISNDFTLNSGALSLNANESIGHDFIMNGGTFAANNFDLTVVHDFIQNAGTVNFVGGGLSSSGNSIIINGGTLNINGQDLTASNDLIIDGGSLVITGSTLAVINDIFITSGTLNLNSNNLTSADQYNLEGGSILNPGTITVENLIVDLVGSKTLNYNLQVNGSAVFTNGYLITSSTSLLIFDNTATVTGASDASHVNGPVRKLVQTSGNTSTFAFPVGNGVRYALIEISSLTQTQNGDYFTAQYFSSRNSNAAGTRDNTLDHVSQAEYWILDRGPSLTATTDVNVRLSFNSTNRSGSVNNINQLRVTKWDASQSKWLDLGAASVSGNATSGNLRTTAVVTSFSPFTIGSTSALSPLPITLLNFTAESFQKNINIKWTTVNEINNDFFTVEKSIDGSNWMEIGTLKAAGTSSEFNDYIINDASPVQGVQFYRLKQTDRNGVFTYSKTVSVNIGANVKVDIYPNPASDILNISVGSVDGSESEILIYDVNGKKVSEIKNNNGTISVLDVSTFKSGLYTIVINTEGNSSSRTFIIK